MSARAWLSPLLLLLLAAQRAAGNAELAPFVGEWVGSLASAVVRVQQSVRLDSRQAAACVAPYARDVTLNVSAAHTARMELDTPLTLPRQRFAPLVVAAVAHMPLAAGTLLAFDRAQHRLDVRVDDGTRDTPACVHAQLAADNNALALWFRHARGDASGCAPLGELARMPSCVAGRIVPDEDAEALGITPVQSSVTFVALRRRGFEQAEQPATSAPRRPDDQSTRGGDGGATDATRELMSGPQAAGGGDEAMTLLAIIGAGIGGVCCIVCAVVLAVVLIVRSRSSASAVEGNPMYAHSTHSTSSALSHSPPRQQLATSRASAVRSSHDDVSSLSLFASTHSDGPPSPTTPSSSGASLSASAQLRHRGRGDTQKIFETVVIDASELHKGKRIGEGAFGVVYKGRWRNVDVAIKECLGDKQAPKSAYNYANLDDKEMRKFKEEAARLKSLRPHANVVPFYGVVLVPVFSIVCQFCEGGSLDALLYDKPLRDLPLKRRWKWLRQIAAGTDHLHREGIVHRDLAARNVLLSADDVAMLTDFGMAREGEGIDKTGRTESRVGPVKWMAPEQLNELSYSQKSDVWSLACIGYELMARQIPWRDDDIPRAIYRIMSGELLQMPADTPPALLALTQRCWLWEPSSRPTMAEVVSILEAATDDATGLPTHSGNQLNASFGTMEFSGAGPARTSKVVTGEFMCDQCGNVYPLQSDLDFHRKKRGHFPSDSQGVTYNFDEQNLN